MKKRIPLLMLLFVSVWISCQSKKAVAESGKSPALEKSLLWKITGNDLTKASYLYGTIHLTCDYKYTDKLRKAFDETDRLVLEIDMSDPSLQSNMMKLIQMENGQTIKKLMSEDDYTKLSDFFKEKVGMDMAFFNGMKPFILTATLTQKMVLCENGTAYETEFMKIAKAQNEDILGLETIEDQMSIFDNIPYEEQLKSLVEMAEGGMDEARQSFEEMTNLYNAEDLEGLRSLMTTQGLEADFQESLVDQRNRNWIPLIEKIAAEAPAFIGVGALHLPGDQGVINLLRKRGYSVEPVF